MSKSSSRRDCVARGPETQDIEDRQRQDGSRIT